MRLSSGDVRRIAIAFVLATAVLAAWTAPLDHRARDHVGESFERALITFGAARALNAVISAAQGTELTFGFGAQATLSDGEVLDPINDLAEQFSNLMHLASVSLGILPPEG